MSKAFFRVPPHGLTMRNRVSIATCITVWASFIGLGTSAGAQILPPDSGAPRKEALVMIHSRGTFDVKVTAQAADDSGEAGSFGRMFLDKQFHGDLEGISKGQMLAAGTGVEGSAGYVALERISGTLNGRHGGFVLQHSGSMSRGKQTMNITVVPDSGTGDLTGIEGRMVIVIEGGKHSFEFDYTLPR